MNLTQIRDAFNSFNDTFKHQNYVPKVKPEIDRQTHEIATWSVFGVIILVAFMTFIYCFNNKHNQINPINSTEKIQNKELKTKNVEDDIILQNVEPNILKDFEVEFLDEIFSLNELNTNDKKDSNNIEKIFDLLDANSNLELTQELAINDTKLSTQKEDSDLKDKMDDFEI